MKKGTVILITCLAIAAIIAVWGIKEYNNLVVAEESVTTAWSNVESQYQRRADLIPNLVNTVKGYASHEQETLDAVISARAKAIQTNISDDLSQENIQKFQAAQNELGNALGRLIAIRESYPDLKANQNFMQLQEQLEGTENRIQVERQKFNETVKSYNIHIRRFPTNIVAGMFNFDAKSTFTSDPNAENAPSVEF
ncbi:MAG: LemA family protein [Paludibacteraceae bacterium]|nr:LemA family protein [Paludibacteraceae bacterium]